MNGEARNRGSTAAARTPVREPSPG